MKRYLYILIAAVSLTACEFISSISTPANITIGKSSVECTENSATIVTEMPSVMVNNTPYTQYTLSLNYVEKELEGVESYITTDDYFVVNNQAKFSIEGLKEKTEYVAYINVDAGSYGNATSEAILFTTKGDTPEASIEFTSKVKAMGVVATMTLRNVAYLVGDKKQSIEYVRVEYCEAEDRSNWTAIDLNSYSDDITIPAEEGDYLTENTDYIYRISIIPADRDLNTITSEEMEFSTSYATVIANIDTPKISVNKESIDITINQVKVYLDGVMLNNYKDIEYSIQHRVAGDETWSEIGVELQDDGIKHSMELSLFEIDTTYEFRGVVIAGAKRQQRTSDIRPFTRVSDDEGGSDDGGSDDGGSDDGGSDDGGGDDGGGDDEEDDTPITPPTPPMSGDADTSDIAGDWHLTSWRGSEPSFDIYLSITEDGVVSLFQRMESRKWETFYSIVGYEDSLIYGEYTDGATWATSYYVSIEGDTMVWTASTDSTDISVYTRCTLPDFTNPGRSAVTNSKRFL